MESSIIDIHTHMLTQRWLDMVGEQGDWLQYKANSSTGKMCIYNDVALFMTPNAGMMDYALRIKKMDEAGVDVAVVSLTCPNVYFGDGATTLATVQNVNDDMAAAQMAYPDCIRWFASLPWQFSALALAELDCCLAKGAVGVVVLGNIASQALTAPDFASVWKAIDDKALPVFIHPTAPPSIGAMGMHEYTLTLPLVFTFDSSLCVARTILDGFFDRYARLKVIAGHGAGTLPYLIDGWTIAGRSSLQPGRRSSVRRANTSSRSIARPSR